MQISDTLAIRIITVISVLIPLVVAFLLFFPLADALGNVDTRMLPHVNAVLNTATSFCLIGGLIAIKSKKRNIHRNFMLTAVVLSTLFLVSYVVYHATTEHTVFGGTGVMRYIYYFILITHIALAVVVVPLVLFAIYFAFTNQIERHKKLVRYTFPVWLYVAVTGVLVYILISPYYQ